MSVVMKNVPVSYSFYVTISINGTFKLDALRYRHFDNCFFSRGCDQLMHRQTEPEIFQ
jgi:hypothetical protein